MWNWQRDIWKPIEGYGEKGNTFRSKLEIMELLHAVQKPKEVAVLHCQSHQKKRIEQQHKQLIEGGKDQQKGKRERDRKSERETERGRERQRGSQG